MPPKCQPLESYFPSTSRNTTLHGDELQDQNIEVVDQVINDDMDGDNISDSNQEDEIHRLIQDTFSPMDEDNQDDSHDVDLYSRSHVNLFMKAQQQIFYLLYFCW